MDLKELEVTLEAALALSRPTPRDVRDALVEYFAAVARPFLMRGLTHTHPDADEALVRRLLLMRLATLWRDLPSSWDRPTLEDLGRFRDRIDHYACVQDQPQFLRTRKLLDDLMLGAAVAERLRAARGGAKTVRQLRVIEGGGETTAPRGRLRLVRAESGPAPTSTGT